MVLKYLLLSLLLVSSLFLAGCSSKSSRLPIVTNKSDLDTPALSPTIATNSGSTLDSSQPQVSSHNDLDIINSELDNTVFDPEDFSDLN